MMLRGVGFAGAAAGVRWVAACEEGEEGEEESVESAEGGAMVASARCVYDNSPVGYIWFPSGVFLKVFFLGMWF